MFNPTLPLTTLTEIVSSGQLAIFQDQKIRSMISNYMFRLELIASNNDRRRANVENLSVMYPELIKRGALITTAPNRTLQRDQCDFSAMMKHQGFKNALNSNALRVDGTTGSLQQAVKTLQEFHAHLDILLNISHPEESS